MENTNVIGKLLNLEHYMIVLAPTINCRMRLFKKVHHPHLAAYGYINGCGPNLENCFSNMHYATGYEKPNNDKWMICLVAKHDLLNKNKNFLQHSCSICANNGAIFHNFMPVMFGKRHELARILKTTFPNFQISNIKMKTFDDSIFNSAYGHDCTIYANENKTVNCQSDCKIFMKLESMCNCENSCTVKADVNCKITCGNNCKINGCDNTSVVSSDYCSIKCSDVSKIISGCGCTITSGWASDIICGSYCSIKVKADSIVKCDDNCDIEGGRYLNVIIRDFGTVKVSQNSNITAGSGTTVKAGRNSIITFKLKKFKSKSITIDNKKYFDTMYHYMDSETGVINSYIKCEDYRNVKK